MALQHDHLSSRLPMQRNHYVNDGGIRFMVLLGFFSDRVFFSAAARQQKRPRFSPQQIDHFLSPPVCADNRWMAKGRHGTTIR